MTDLDRQTMHMLHLYERDARDLSEVSRAAGREELSHELRRLADKAGELYRSVLARTWQDRSRLDGAEGPGAQGSQPEQPDDDFEGEWT